MRCLARQKRATAAYCAEGVPIRQVGVFSWYVFAQPLESSRPQGGMRALSVH